MKRKVVGLFVEYFDFTPDSPHGVLCRVPIPLTLGVTHWSPFREGRDPEEKEPTYYSLTRFNRGSRENEPGTQREGFPF